MKKFIEFLLFLIAMVTVAPQLGLAQNSNIADLLHFTAVAREANGDPIVNTPVYVNVKIYTGNPANAGTLEYCEQTSNVTNDFGEFSLEFGTNPILLCQPQKQMSEVPWYTGNKWVDISFQTNPGNQFIPIATFKLTSVPFAFASRTAERTLGIETAGASSGQVLKYDGQKFIPGADQAGDGVPVGTIIAFAGPASKKPTGWLLCNGEAKDRTQFAALFDVVGNFWGSGNGTTTFNLPDLRGQFLRGATSDSNLDPDVSDRTVSAVGLPKSEVGSKQNDAFQKHAHRTQVANGNGNDGNGVRIVTSSAGTESGLIRSTGGAATNFNPLTVSNAIEDGTNGAPRLSIETRPRNVYVNYIIKY